MSQDNTYIATDLPPYRVEWRPNLICRWGLITQTSDREHAQHAADDARAAWDGQTRIITQHVIEVAGL